MSDPKPVTRLWTDRSRYTVQQALDETSNEHAEYDLDKVITIGEYQDSALMVKSSRMDHQEALWLLTRALNHVTQEQFKRDNDDD